MQGQPRSLNCEIYWGAFVYSPAFRLGLMPIDDNADDDDIIC